MVRIVFKLVALALVTAAAGGGLWMYAQRQSEADRIIEEQRQQIETLENIAVRLQADRRVADILVTDQTRGSDGRMRTTLLFVEYGREGQPLPPRRFEVVGDMVHIDSKLIKFERHFVREGDPLRGQSIALFEKIYGSATAPDDGQAIDTPGRTPAIYKGTDPAQTAFEQELWENFWRLTRDNAYAAGKGVRVAQGQSVWGMFSPDRLYTVELEAAGGLSLTSEPLKPIYRAAFESMQDATDAALGPAATQPGRN